MNKFRLTVKERIVIETYNALYCTENEWFNKLSAPKKIGLFGLLFGAMAGVILSPALAGIIVGG